jgi:protein associated with RNAse G/E
MARSFAERWTKDASLTVYAEGFDPEDDRVSVRSLPAWQSEFKDRWHNNPAARGIREDGTYTYVNDAIKFSHKVAALTDAGLSTDADVMIWMDADTFTHSDVHTAWLMRLFPAPHYIAYLDRQRSHIESGFVMYRTVHAAHRSFMEAFRDIYTSGEIFSLPQTTDCHVLQKLVYDFRKNNLIGHHISLSGYAYKTSHPFVMGPLSACMDHMKGPRKKVGRTPKNERRGIRDGNPYWS